MSAKRTVQKLLSAKPGRTIEHVADELTRQAARVAWVRETSAALREAQREADQAWERLLAPIPDDEARSHAGAHDEHCSDDEGLEDLPEPPEQAKADAIFAQLRAVADHDRWPRHLHWSL